MKKRTKKFILLASGITLGVHFINKFIEEGACEKNLLKTNMGHYYSWKYGNIFYKKEGKGKPIILIHDLRPASSGAEWEKVTKDLSRTNTVYTIDLLGCGRSDKPNITYINYFYVQLLNDFIKDVVGEQAIIVASGRSSSFAAMASAMNPQHYEKVIMVNPAELQALSLATDNKKLVMKAIMKLPIYGTLLYHLFTKYNHIKYLLEESFHDQRCLKTDTVNTYYESAHLKQGKGRFLMASMIANNTGVNMQNALKSAKNLSMIIGTEKEDIYDTKADYLKLNPDIQVYEISKTKALPQLEASRKFCDTLHQII